MNLNRALAVLAKKFTVNSDTFRGVSKETLISWAQSVADGAMAEKVTGKNTYKLTRHQHAFLVGDLTHIPFERNVFEF